MRRLPSHRLWFGHAGAGRDLRLLFAHDIAAVVDLADSEPPLVLPREMIYGRFPWVDGPDNPPWLLTAALQLTVLLIRQDIPTLVCCGAGMSRSPALVSVALSHVRQCTPEDCLVEVAALGPIDVTPQLWADLKSVSVPLRHHT